MDAEIQSFIANKVEDTVNRSQNNLLSSLENLLTSKLESFKHEMADKQRQLSDSQFDRLQTINDNYIFKRKSCEDQHKFNTKVYNKLKEAEHKLADPTIDSSSAAKNFIAEGISFLNHREKVIKLADSSEFGWKVAEEYEANPLADDSDDERKMYRASMRAQRKAKVERFRRSRFQRRFQPYDVQSSSVVPTPTTTRRFNSSNIRNGLCFSCGKPGHWRFECPETAPKPSSDKISIDLHNFNDFNCMGKFVCEEQVLGKIQNTGSYLNDVDRVNQARLNEQVNVCHVENKGKVHNHTGKACNQNSCLAFVGSDQGSTGVQQVQNIAKLTSNASDSVAVKHKVHQTPVGKLKGNIKHWKKCCSNPFVLDVICNGYKLPFIDAPPTAEFKNNRSARDAPDFVTKEIKKLVSLGCVSIVKDKPCVINPLTVAYNREGKQRLVLDCRHINLYLYKTKFKYEDVSVARHFLQKGDYVFSFDLKSAYHHIEIFEQHRNYLGFSWFIDGAIKHLVFNVLPFGIATAGYIFTKVVREMVKYWRSKGLRVIMYLDDRICGCSSTSAASEASKFIVKSLEQFGFLIADEKCSWQPSNFATWLGIVWDFEQGKVRITNERVKKLANGLQYLLGLIKCKNHFVYVRILACIVGHIMSMHVVFGNLARMKTRCMYRCILSRTSWNSVVGISKEAVNEIEYWNENLCKLNQNGSDFVVIEEYMMMLFSDASEGGFGGYLATCDGALAEGSEVIGSWCEQEKKQSSTWRELEGIHRVLASSIDQLTGKNIKVVTDSKNAETIIKIGSTKSHLHSVVCNIDQLCYANDIILTPVWVPRVNLQQADFLSRCSDSDDWGISFCIFNQLDQVWGPHTLDCFAVDYNTKCHKFFSRWWCSGSQGIDAFKQSWEQENIWLVPPPRLICKAVQKLKRDGASATLVIPEWKSAPFSPFWHFDNSFSKFIVALCRLPRENVVVPGRGNNGIFSKKKLTFDMVAVRLDFRNYEF